MAKDTESFVDNLVVKQMNSSINGPAVNVLFVEYVDLLFYQTALHLCVLSNEAALRRKYWRCGRCLQKLYRKNAIAIAKQNDNKYREHC